MAAAREVPNPNTEHFGHALCLPIGRLARSFIRLAQRRTPYPGSRRCTMPRIHTQQHMSRHAGPLHRAAADLPPPASSIPFLRQLLGEAMRLKADQVCGNGSTYHRVSPSLTARSLGDFSVLFQEVEWRPSPHGNRNKHGRGAGTRPEGMLIKARTVPLPILDRTIRELVRQRGVEVDRFTVTQI